MTYGPIILEIAAQIDREYPVAGRDNNSQGFRDNFTYIQSGLKASGDAVVSLEQSSAKLNKDNNFNGVLIENAVTNQIACKVNEYTLPYEEVSISFENGKYHIVNVASNITMVFGGWPEDNTGNASDMPAYGNMLVEINNTDSSNLEILLNSNNSTTLKFNGLGNPLLVPGNSTILVEVWSASGGETVFFKNIGEFVTINT